MSGKLILASASIRRRSMFSMLGLSYEVLSPDVDESVKDGTLPEDAVKIISRRKVASLNADPDDFAISADTVVALDGEIFGKPKDKDDALRMLRALSGRDHSVYTGFSIRHGNKIYTESVLTKVTFRALSEREINIYIDLCNPFDKAGAYGIQEFAGVFSEKIEGDINNVIGLPLCALETAMRREFSSSLFDFISSDKV